MPPKTKGLKPQNHFASLDDATYGPENSHNVLFLSTSGALALAAERGLLQLLKKAPTKHQIGHAASQTDASAGARSAQQGFTEEVAVVLAGLKIGSLREANERSDSDSDDEDEGNFDLLDLDDLDLADFDILVELEVCSDTSCSGRQAAPEEQGKLRHFQWNLLQNSPSKERSAAASQEVLYNLNRELATLVDLFEDSAVKRACGQGTSC
mmetsp:Transcript_34123/g.50527  ORF Transcript_34123/g.50527 Transcript_34123/m.50527 type:complete len:210 (+) Transcript_34123:3-632(+)